MEEIEKTLEKIGLTGSEIKLYLALLKLGLSSKGKLISEAKTAPSKFYEVIEKLIDKGLCSTIIKNGVKYFNAAPLSKVKDFLESKKKEIIEEEKEFEKIMPKLNSLINKTKEETKIEVFMGWKGMETAYTNYMLKAIKNDEVLIIGAGIGKREDKLETFYSKYGNLALNKGVKIRAIFNENAKEYVKRIENNIGIKYEKKFLFNNTPSEILIFKSLTAIIIKKEEPIVLLIEDKETSNSFKAYFNELWKIAKK
jgi:sugar-specific transcriptional regulator TrmB